MTIKTYKDPFGGSEPCVVKCDICGTVRETEVYGALGIARLPRILTGEWGWVFYNRSPIRVECPGCVGKGSYVDRPLERDELGAGCIGFEGREPRTIWDHLEIDAWR